MHPDAALESTGGGVAGKFEVLDSYFKVHRDKEFEPKPGQKPRGVETVTALAWKVTPVADDGERLEDADTREIVFKMGGKSLAMFHPAKGSGPDDTDPDDLGTELNTQGNTLTVPEGAKVEMNAKSAYSVMTKSLKHKGFDGDKIAACWAPYYKGLKIDILTVTADKLEGYGQKKGDDASITYKVCQGVIAFPDAKAKKGEGKTAAAAPKAEKKQEKVATPKPADDDDDTDAGSNSDSESSDSPAETEAFRVLTAVSVKLAGKEKKIDQTKTFWITMYSDPKVKGAQKLQDAARKFVNDEMWLVEKLTDLKAKVNADERTVTFAEAA